jgi:hypothetical protein
MKVVAFSSLDQVKTRRKSINRAYTELPKKAPIKAQKPKGKPKTSVPHVRLELSKADALEIVQALLENATPTRRKIASGVRTSLKAGRLDL